MKLIQLSIPDGYNVIAKGLTANAIDHEWVQLFLAVYSLAREVWHGLDLSMKQVVQQCQCHFLCCAAVCGDMEHVSWRHWATNSHLWVVLISQPGARWIIIWREYKKDQLFKHGYTALFQQTCGLLILKGQAVCKFYLAFLYWRKAAYIYTTTCTCVESQVVKYYTGREPLRYFM